MKFGNIFKSLKAKVLAATAAVTVAFRIRFDHAYRETQHLPREEQGRLENRFHYARPLGGFRLQRTSKHRHGKLTRHQVALRQPAGMKLWKKAGAGIPGMGTL